MNNGPNWKLVYGLLIVALGVQILVYYGLTQYFS